MVSQINEATRPCEVGRREGGRKVGGERERERKHLTQPSAYQVVYQKGVRQGKN